MSTTKHDDPIIVYWAPAGYNLEHESWSLTYSEPVSVLSNFLSETTSKSEIRSCPATKSLFKNTFAINSALEERIDLSNSGLELKAGTESRREPVGSGAKIELRKERQSSYPGYINVTYNLSWLFFASEPVKMRWTAPYFPASQPTQGSLFSPGVMDIGQWFRPVNLDYHIPVSANSFNIDEGQPLAFVEIETDRRVVFERFELSNRLWHLSTELSSSSTNYGKNKSLIQRYKMAKNSRLSDRVLSEIRKNLIDK